MIVPFYQVVGWIDAFLNRQRQNGLAGNIIRTISPPEWTEAQAMWAGAQHQLAFCGTEQDYWLVLSTIAEDESPGVVLMIEHDPTQFEALLIQFFVLEG